MRTGLFLTFLFLGWFAFAGPLIGPLCAESAGKNQSGGDVEVVIDGRSYSSVRQYKLDKLMSSLEGSLTKENKQSLNEFLTRSLDELNEDDLKNYSNAELRQMVLKLIQLRFDPSQGMHKSSDIIQMKEMLLEYESRNSKKTDVKLDAGTVKTIVISPDPIP